MKFDIATIAADPARLAGCWWKIWMDASQVVAGAPAKDSDSESPGLLIAPMDIAYDRAIEEARKPYLDQIRSGSIENDTLRKIQAKALSKTVLRGWRNLTENGKDLPAFSEDLAEQILSDVKWIWLTNFVETAGRYKAATLKQEEASAAGN